MQQNGSLADGYSAPPMVSNPKIFEPYRICWGNRTRVSLQLHQGFFIGIAAMYAAITWYISRRKRASEVPAAEHLS